VKIKKKCQFALTLFGFVGLLVILVSWENYKVGMIAPIAETTPVFSNEAKGLAIIAKSYSHNESRSYLHRDLIKRGYQPIQITIQNNTPKSYALSREGISLPTASPGKVARAVMKESIPRSIGLKIASFLFWPFMIPSTIDGIVTMRSHYLLRKDLSAKAVKEKDKEEVVLPYSIFNRVVFVPKEELRETMTVTLIEHDSDDLTSFICSLNPSEEEKIVLNEVE
jgi:hypothetical protein